MALSASYYEIWLPILFIIITAVITYFSTRQTKKFIILKRVFLFVKQILETFGENLSGGISTEEWEKIIPEIMEDLRNMLLDIAESFEIGESAELEEAKESVTNGDKLTWTKTDKVLTERDTTKTTNKIKKKMSSLHFKKK